MAKEGILLESGTNEVEILEFVLAGQGFGVNVAKIQAIEQYDPEKLTVMPLAPESMAGMLLFRDRTIPLMDLTQELNVVARSDGQNSVSISRNQIETNFEQRIVLVMEFNGITSAVLADGVNRIHRISWQDISPLSPVLSQCSAEFTGSVNIEGREILIVDMEHIIGTILPDAQLRGITDEHLQSPQRASRAEVKVVLAEDSGTIRGMIVGVLKKGGYTQVTDFDNGQSAYDYIQQLKTRAETDETDILDEVSLIISDIEMPKMDGLTLCKSVKTGLGLKQVPVVMFSSLINEQMARKCESVGANAYISKPKMNELIQMLDELCLAGATDSESEAA